MTAATTSKFNIMYDTYSPLLYGIALQIAPTEREAEQIIITTFTNAHQQKIEQQKDHTLYISLLKMIIQAAHQQLNNNIGKTNFKLKQFQNTPMLHQLICEQMSFENYCIENKIAKEQGLKDFRNELSSFIKSVIKKHVSVNEMELESYNFVKPLSK